jgi:hypothetical protein
LELPSHPVDGFPYGVFTAGFCNGCGYDDGIYYADIDIDSRIGLFEMQYYINNFIVNVFGDIDQDVQVYPELSNFTLYEY